MVIAYQTDRNEFVGICKVVQHIKRGNHSEVELEPQERVGVTVQDFVPTCSEEACPLNGDGFVRSPTGSRAVTVPRAEAM